MSSMAPAVQLPLRDAARGRLEARLALRGPLDERLVGEELEILSSGAVPALIQILSEAARRRAERAKRARRIEVAATVSLCAAILLLPDNAVLAKKLSFVIVSVATFGGSILRDLFSAPTRTQRNAAFVLARFDHQEAIGHLIDAYSYVTGPAYEAVSGALTRILPTLRASDAHLISTKQQSLLCDILALEPRTFGAKNRLIDLQVAILRALEQVGDEQAIPAVTQLADRWTTRNPPRPVAEAARACLPALKARVALSQKHGHLLRPAASPDSEQLLRPATESETEAAVLLRPMDGAP